MFAFLKKIFTRQQPAPVPAAVEVPQPLPANSPAPVPAAAPKPPAPVPRAPVAPPPAHTPAPVTFSKETIDLPLKSLWAKLSEDVRKIARNEPGRDALLKLPVNVVQVHLAKGSMKLPLVQFRQFSPEGIFPDNSAHDTTEVIIPISEILPRLRPEHLPRRAGQRRIEVPDDIEPIFGPDGTQKGNLRISQEKAKPVAAVPAAGRPAPAAPPRPVESHDTNIFTRAQVEPPATPPPASVVAAEEPVTPVAPVTPVTPISPIAPAPAAVAPSFEPPPQPVPEPEPIRAPRLDPALATLRPGKPAAPTEKTLNVALMDVAAFWAERGKIELENLYRHNVEFPIGIIQAALRRGKVEFPWRELKPWVRLASGNSLPEIPAETKIEFPLSLIAPRFFELQAQGAPKKRIQIGEEIPDVFVRHEVAAPAPPPPPAPAPAAAVEEKPSGELGDILGQPEKKEWSFGEITQRTASLPGVAGAIIATSDGLLIGGSWPGAVGTEAVAAFVPQIYNRLSNYTSELKLGSPADFTLLVEDVPLRIFKSANSYFTVLGRAGESLPDHKLKAIATRLAETATEYEPKAN